MTKKEDLKKLKEEYKASNELIEVYEKELNNKNLKLNDIHYKLKYLEQLKDKIPYTQYKLRFYIIDAFVLLSIIIFTGVSIYIVNPAVIQFLPLYLCSLLFELDPIINIIKSKKFLKENKLEDVLKKIEEANNSKNIMEKLTNCKQKELNDLKNNQNIAKLEIEKILNESVEKNNIGSPKDDETFDIMDRTDDPIVSHIWKMECCNDENKEHFITLTLEEDEKVTTTHINKEGKKVSEDVIDIKTEKQKIKTINMKKDSN